jgi:sec-independent protein translocase protein TatA
MEIMLLVFGPKRRPEMGRSLGRGIREFKESVTGEDKDDDDEPRKTELTPPPAATPDATTTQRESERV